MYGYCLVYRNSFRVEYNITVSFVVEIHGESWSMNCNQTVIDLYLKDKEWKQPNHYSHVVIHRELDGYKNLSESPEVYSIFHDLIQSINQRPFLEPSTEAKLSPAIIHNAAFCPSHRHMRSSLGRCRPETRWNVCPLPERILWWRPWVCLMSRWPSGCPRSGKWWICAVATLEYQLTTCEVRLPRSMRPRWWWQYLASVVSQSLLLL